MKSAKMTVWVMVVVLVATGVSKADLTAYIATWSSSSVVYTTDLVTGAQTPIGGPSGVSSVRALEVSPIDGTIFATTGPKFWSISRITGAGTLIGNMQAYIINMAFSSDGSLYGISDDDDLFEIDTLTGDTTLIGSLSPYISANAFAIDSYGKGIAWDSGANWLFEIDLSDASTTSLGYLEVNFDAFDYGPDGVLYQVT